MLLIISMVNDFLELLMKKNCRRQIKKYSQQKKGLKENEISYVSNGEDVTIDLMARMKKMKLYKMSQYFQKP